jgi:alpha-beta hydrolase superfamily lysophospholipase
MFPEPRRRLIRILRRLVIWPIAVLAAAVAGFSAYAVLALEPLAPWHSLELKEEFEAQRDGRLDFAGLLALEGRLFDELRHAKLLRSGDPAEERSSRFSPASWVARLTGGPGNPDSGDVYSAPYNRTFEFVPAERRGSALLIHGLTDAPYSMLALARRLHARGLHVVVLRLPGHGTVPAGQLRMTLEDWRAAVRIAARHAASLAAPDQPFYLGGFSTGGTLALTHAVESLGDATLRRPTRVLLVSPAIELPRIAVLTRIIDALAFLPGLQAAHWQEILPEYDPYKYNSFAVNSTRQVLAATNALTRALDQAQAAGLLGKLPPVTAWQSVVDSTVGARGVFDSVFGRLAGEQHELVLFDVNRLAVFRSLETARIAGLPQLLPGLERPHTLTVVANRNDASEQVVMRRRTPGQAWTEIETGFAWPRSIVSVGHVALCFPPDDPVYGFMPGSGANGQPALGSLFLRGEAGALSLPLSMFTRLRSNPFFVLIANRVDEMLDADFRMPRPR